MGDREWGWGTGLREAASRVMHPDRRHWRGWRQHQAGGSRPGTPRRRRNGPTPDSGRAFSLRTATGDEAGSRPATLLARRHGQAATLTGRVRRRGHLRSGLIFVGGHACWPG